MYIKIFMQQLRRGKMRTDSYVLLLVAVVAFFVMSVNLYQNSQKNLKAVEENYSTIALMELYGDVNEYGELVDASSERQIGYKSVAVAGYDFSAIVEADCVTSWDLRSKYGAAIENNVAMQGADLPMLLEDAFRFRIAGEEPIVLDLNWEEYGRSKQKIELDILDTASKCFSYSGTFYFRGFQMYRSAYRDFYSNQVKQINRSEETDSITLYPGVEYMIITSMGSNWHPSETQGMLSFGEREGSTYPSLSPCTPTVGELGHYINYSGSEYPSSLSGPEAGEPFPLQRWEDVQRDPEMKAYFDFVWKAMEIQNHTYTVSTTNDFTSIPAYHLGGVALKEGRLVDEEEYKNGAKVCLVSDELAAYQQWEIGDKLPMQFFEFDGFINREFELFQEQPVYSRETEGFFDRGEYEIVGIYTQHEVTGNSSVAKSTMTLPWYVIFVPEKSVENQPAFRERPVHGSLLSIRLRNGSIGPFSNHIEALGFLEEKEGQFHPVFSFYDQGYSVVQPGLEAMNGTAKLLLGLSSILLLVTCVLLSFFFAQNQKQSIGIFRMLGGSKAQALRGVLACALLLTIIGATLGAILGYGLTQYVGAGIMEDNLSRSEAAATYQAYVLQSERADGEELAVEPEPALTTCSALTAMLFPALSAIFVLQDVKKEPRALLPKSGG